jgi:hypothetical protein
MALAVLLAVVALAAVAAVFLFGFQSDGPTGPPRAVIVDQLSLTQPNPTFADSARRLLEQAGYEVDYFPGEEVTVDFYRALPTGGYDLVLLRAHAGRTREEEGLTDDTCLFTSEPYSPSTHIEEQSDGRLCLAYYTAGGPEYFGIPPAFLTSSMKGEFRGASIILMGCDVLRAASMAEAFVEIGATIVVGWDGMVSAAHTDAATERLLQHLLVDRHGIREAVTQAMAEVGLDPEYGSKLLVYPAEPSASAAP